MDCTGGGLPTVGRGRLAAYLCRHVSLYGASLQMHKGDGGVGHARSIDDDNGAVLPIENFDTPQSSPDLNQVHTY